MSTAQSTESDQPTAGRPPRNKLIAFPFSMSEFIKQVTADDGRTYDRSHWVFSKRVVNRMGDVEFKDISLFPNEIPLIRALLEKIEREYVIRTETNGTDSHE